MQTITGSFCGMIGFFFLIITPLLHPNQFQEHTTLLKIDFPPLNLFTDAIMYPQITVKIRRE